MIFMDLLQAYDIIKAKNPGLEPVSVLDFDSFYLFSLAPPDMGDEDIETGRIFPTIDKTTGKVGEYDITSDLDAFERALKRTSKL